MIATITSSGLEAPISYWQFAAFAVAFTAVGAGLGAAITNLIRARRNRRLPLARMSVLHKL